MRYHRRHAIADHAAGRARQVQLPRPHAQRFQADAGCHQQRERKRLGHPAALPGWRVLVIGRRLVADQLAVGGAEPAHQQQDPAVGGNAEQQQQHVGDPGADAAAPVGDVIDLQRMEPAWIPGAVAQQGDQQKGRAEHLRQPAEFGQQARHSVRKGRRARRIIEFCHRSGCASRAVGPNYHWASL